MPRLHLHHCRTLELPCPVTPESLAPLKTAVPKSAVRRMTQLGLQVAHVLAERPPHADEPLIYVSRFAETRTLEQYLASFPQPSPMLFQASIHPSAVEQALIAWGRPLCELHPLIGRPALAASALQTLFRCLQPGVPPPSPNCAHLVLGEEAGSWLAEAGIASDRSFAAALVFSSDPNGALATLSWEPNGTAPGEPTEDLTGLFEALQTRRTWHLSQPGFGDFALHWHL